MMTPHVLEVARELTASQDWPLSTLYVVPTPIGNFADLSLRAIAVLGGVDAVACEDTRHTRTLLQRLGIDANLLSVHEHNEKQASAGVIERLALGQRVAYVSDAGTPAISDPGAVLVREVHAAGFRVVPLPGPNTAATALSAAGDTLAKGFAFIGFLPPKTAARQTALKALLQRTDESLVLFEAPHRIVDLAQDLRDLWPAHRLITVCKELTKQFELVATWPAPQWLDWLLADTDRQRGEWAVVLHAQAADVTHVDEAAHDPLLNMLLTEMSVRSAAQLAAQITGAPRKMLYQRALTLSGANSDPE